ncbi:MAG: hypothetical protein K1X44_07835 [Alphaproteobacteria bacterium]|nr:hypothetical protein [Alphaproteobacteria bacterium]
MKINQYFRLKGFAILWVLGQLLFKKSSLIPYLRNLFLRVMTLSIIVIIGGLTFVATGLIGLYFFLIDQGFINYEVMFIMAAGIFVITLIASIITCTIFYHKNSIRWTETESIHQSSNPMSVFESMITSFLNELLKDDKKSTSNKNK